MLDQQGTDEWLASRAGKVTASRISDVMMKPATAGYTNYRAQLVCERITGKVVEGFKSNAMMRGTELEPRARAFYELEKGCTVEQVGLIDHPRLAHSGASPDGLVGNVGLVEIKCPELAEHIRMLTGGEIKRQYALQMQWQMACTGREWCDFVSFNPDFESPLDFHCQRVGADAEAQEEITEAVTKFLAEVGKLEAQLLRTKTVKEVA